MNLSDCESPQAALPRGVRDLLEAVALRPGDTSFVLARALQIEGEFSEEVLRRCLACLVSRHASLRKKVVSVGGMLTLCEEGARPFPLAFASWEGASQEEIDGELARIASTSLDLSISPLARAHLMQVGPGRNLLVLVAHHLVCDLTSASILVKELLADLASTEETCSTQDIPLVEPARAYSTSPKDLPDGELQVSRQAASLCGTWDAELSSRLESFSRTNGVRPFALLLAAWSWINARERDVSCIEVGVFSRGRTRADVHRTGQFATVVDVAVEMQPDVAGITYVRQVAALAGDLGLGTMTDRPPKRSRASVLLGYQKASRLPSELDAAFALGQMSSPVRMGSLVIQSWQMPVSRIGGELCLCVGPHRGGWMWRIDFDNSHERNSIAYTALHLEVFLRQLLENPLRPLHAVSMLGLHEVGTVVGPKLRPGEDMLTLIAAWVARDPDRVAIVSGNTSWSYAQVWQASAAIASRLASRGVGRGRVVAVASEPSAESVSALLGVLRTGAAFLPLPADHAPRRLQTILENAMPTLTLASRSHAGRTILPSLVLIEDWLAEGLTLDAGTQSATGCHPGDPAYILYTSGSSGRPKGVEVSRANLEAFLVSAAQALPVGAQDRCLLLQPFTFDISLLEAFLPLTQGASLVVAEERDRRDSTRLAQTLRASRITVMQATPTIWGQLVASGWSDGEGMLALCGGEALLPRLAADLLATKVQLWNLYGPTETTIWSSCSQITDPTRIHIGQPLPGFTLQVLDENLAPTPMGCVGELWIGGVGVANGYRADPVRTSYSFMPDPERAGVRRYRTGDRVRREVDGRLVYLGRADHQVKIAGHRIEIGEIEAALAAVVGTPATAVVDMKDAGGRVGVVGFVALPSEHAFDEDVVRVRLMDLLPPNMVPRRILIVAVLPMLASGKKNLQVLRQLACAAPASSAGPTVGDQTTSAVLDIWSSILGESITDPDMDFFATGGQSLDLMRSVDRIEEVFGVRLSMDGLWRAPCARAVAHNIQLLLSRALRRVHDASVPASETYRATQAQQRIWVAHQLDAAGTLYSCPMLLEVKGVLRTEHLQQVLDDLAAAHDVLNSRFYLRDGELWARLAAPSFPLTVIHSLVAVAGKDPVADSIETELAIPFDLENGPLARALWIDEGNEGGMLLLTVHHIVFDGGSVPVLVKGLAEGLRHRRAGTVTARAPQSQFASHAACLNSPAEVAPSLLSYWQRRVAGPFWNPSNERLVPHEPAPGLSGAFRIDLPPQFTHELRRHARLAGISVFSFLVALIGRTMRDATGHSRHLFAVDISMRVAAAAQDGVGMYVEQLLVPVNLQDDSALAEVAKSVHLSISDGIANFVPLGVLARELNAGRLDRIKLAELPFDAAPIDIDAGLTIHPYASQLAPARHDMTFFLLTGGHQTIILIDFDPRYCNSGLGQTIERQLRQHVDELGALLSSKK